MATDPIPHDRRMSGIIRFLALACTLLALPVSASAQAGEQAAAPGEADDRTVVAVLYFDNHTGVERYGPLGKGLAEMLITDLSTLRSLRLVERSRLQDLIDEVEFSGSEHSDPETALEIGRFLAARYVVTGAFTGVEPELRVDGRLIRTETAEIVVTAQARGSEERFFEIHEELAEALIDGLALELSDEEWLEFRRVQEQNRLEDAETALAYSEALHLYDRGEYVDALERMAYVARRAPASGLVDLTHQHMQAAAREAARETAREESRSFLGRMLRGIFGGG
jgi:TolB-like protein